MHEQTWNGWRNGRTLGLPPRVDRADALQGRRREAGLQLRLQLLERVLHAVRAWLPLPVCLVCGYVCVGQS